MIRGFLKSIDPYVTKSNKFLLGDEPMFVDCVLVTLYTDFLVNSLRHSRPKFDAVNKEFPQFETYAKRVMMWAGEYYK